MTLREEMADVEKVELTDASLSENDEGEMNADGAPNSDSAPSGVDAGGDPATDGSGGSK